MAIQPALSAIQFLSLALPGGHWECASVWRHSQAEHQREFLLRCQRNGSLSRICVKEEVWHSIDLLNWQNHFTCIKSFPAFMSEHVQRHKRQWCRCWLGHVSNEASLDLKKRYCQCVEDRSQICNLREPSVKVIFKKEGFGHYYSCNYTQNLSAL